jgi:hypothetical protein
MSKYNILKVTAFLPFSLLLLNSGVLFPDLGKNKLKFCNNKNGAGEVVPQASISVLIHIGS